MSATRKGSAQSTSSTAYAASGTPTRKPMDKQEQAEADALIKGWEKEDPQSALDEIDRECRVRARCFPRWVTEGRMSATEARDRARRLFKAFALLQGYMQQAEADTQGE